MKYYQLRNWLDTLSDEQLEEDVTIHLATEDEWIPVVNVGVTTKDDVLHKGHFYLEIEE